MTNPLHSLLAFTLLGAGLSAQATEWVANGEFNGTLAPWVMGGGYSNNPGLEIGWDTTGMGVSDSFGVSAGGLVTPAPYPPNTLEQNILVIPGLVYEFRADLSGARPANPTLGNADTGTIWVEVNGVEVARFALGRYNPSPPETKRVQVCGRFTTAASGLVPLTIYFERRYLSNSNTPRMNLDNVSVKDTIGPTYWINSNRKLNTSVEFAVDGPAGEPFGAFLSGGITGGSPIPGMLGLWYLDFATMVAVGSGTLDANGQARMPLLIPNLPFLVTTPLHYQAVGAEGGVLGLGHPSSVVFVN